MENVFPHYGCQRYVDTCQGGEYHWCWQLCGGTLVGRWSLTLNDILDNWHCHNNPFTKGFGSLLRSRSWVHSLDNSPIWIFMVARAILTCDGKDCQDMRWLLFWIHHCRHPPHTNFNKFLCFSHNEVEPVFMTITFLQWPKTLSYVSGP